MLPLYIEEEQTSTPISRNNVRSGRRPLFASTTNSPVSRLQYVYMYLIIYVMHVHNVACVHLCLQHWPLEQRIHVLVKVTLMMPQAMKGKNSYYHNYNV